MLLTPGTNGKMKDDFHAREVLHVTFGSVLAQYGVQLKSALARHLNAYHEGLRVHFKKYLSLLA